KATRAGGTCCRERLKLRIRATLQCRVAEDTTEPRGKECSRGLKDLENVGVGDTTGEGAEHLAVLVVEGGHARVNGGSHVEVGNLGVNGSGTNAGSLTVAEACDNRDLLRDVPGVANFLLDVAKDLTGLVQVSHLTAV